MGTKEQQVEKLIADLTEYMGALDKLEVQLNEMEKTFSRLKNEGQDLFRKLMAENTKTCNSNELLES